MAAFFRVVVFALVLACFSSASTLAGVFAEVSAIEISASGSSTAVLLVRDLVAAVEQAKKAGKDADQAATDIKLPEKYKDYNTGRLKANITAIYSELK